MREGEPSPVARCWLDVRRLVRLAVAAMAFPAAGGYIAVVEALPSAVPVLRLAAHRPAPSRRHGKISCPALALPRRRDTWLLPLVVLQRVDGWSRVDSPKTRGLRRQGFVSAEVADRLVAVESAAPARMVVAGDIAVQATQGLAAAWVRTDYPKTQKNQKVVAVPEVALGRVVEPAAVARMLVAGDIVVQAAPPAGHMRRMSSTGFRFRAEGSHSGNSSCVFHFLILFNFPFCLFSSKR